MAFITGDIRWRRVLQANIPCLNLQADVLKWLGSPGETVSARNSKCASVWSFQAHSSKYLTVFIDYCAQVMFVATVPPQWRSSTEPLAGLWKSSSGTNLLISFISSDVRTGCHKATPLLPFWSTQDSWMQQLMLIWSEKPLPTYAMHKLEPF